MADIIQIRRDTAANWASVNPVLAQGELGYELDTRTLRIGDAVTAFTSLPPINAVLVQDEGVDVVTTNALNFVGPGVTVTDSGGIATITITGGGSGAVISVFGRTGAVVAASGDYNASQIDFNNTVSGLSAATVQAAIDEVEGRVDALESAPGAPVDSVFGRIGAVVAQAGDYDATQVDFDNALSGMAAATVQAALDILDSRVDTLESTPFPVLSVFGRTGSVVATAGDYDATQIDFDNTGTNYASTDVDGALKEIDTQLSGVGFFGCFQSRNTNTTTNLNTTGLTQVPIMGTIDQPGPTGLFTVIGNEVRINQAAKVRISTSVLVNSNSSRTNLFVGMTVNGVTQQPRAASFYSRATQGHNDTSGSLSMIVDVPANALLGVSSQREAGSGNVTMLAGGSVFTVEVLELA